VLQIKWGLWDAHMTKRRLAVKKNTSITSEIPQKQETKPARTGARKSAAAGVVAEAGVGERPASEAPARRKRSAKVIAAPAAVSSQPEVKQQEDAPHEETTEAAAFASATIGIDLGDKKSQYVVLDSTGAITEEGKVETNDPKLRSFLSRFRGAVVAIEVGTHSPWISRLITECGHQALVANARKVKLISRNKRKNNRIDALTLARLARADQSLLYPIRHRGAEAQADLAVLRARDAMVRTRTRSISHVRGAVKSVGGRLPKCSAESFIKRCRDLIPQILVPALEPILDQIVQINKVVAEYDRTIEAMLDKYPDAQKLTQITGVGSLTALAYMLVLEDARRFVRSRSTGAYLGLVPGSDDTGDDHVQKGITKEGDKFVRRLLVGSAQYILGPFGPDCDLRRHGEAMAARGGKNAKKRAVVAIARKLAVLLHRLWICDEAYDPFYNAKRREVLEASAA
jgi:transposase